MATGDDIEAGHTTDEQDGTEIVAKGWQAIERYVFRADGSADHNNIRTWSAFRVSGGAKVPEWWGSVGSSKELVCAASEVWLPTRRRALAVAVQV